MGWGGGGREIHPAAGSKWRAQWTAGLLSARDVGIYAPEGKDVNKKAAKCCGSRMCVGEVC